MSHKRRFFVLLCLALCLLFCVPVSAHAANPPDYERAKATLARLQAGNPGPNSWQACADEFRKVYNNNPKWNLRVAALFRCGVALEKKARVTKSKTDAKNAVSAYEQSARKFPSSALADDALFRAAVVCNELLNDKKKARVHLEHIARRYFRADHAKIAAEYREQMDGKGGNGASSSRKEKTTISRPPSGAGANMLAAQLGLSVRTIIIDPGHGGRDPGAMHNGVVEQDVNLDIAKRLRTINEASGQLETSGITVDPVKGTVWMCSWVGEESGRYLYEYDLDGNYLRKVHLQPVPQWVQGVFYHDGSLFLTADDGTADDNEPDHLYRVDISSASNAPVILEKTFTEAIRQGEIEGLCVDPSTGDLLVHQNRGARIVLGMTKGMYPGYKSEVHEIYRYKLTPNK